MLWQRMAAGTGVLVVTAGNLTRYIGFSGNGRVAGSVRFNNAYNETCSQCYKQTAAVYDDDDDVTTFLIMVALCNRADHYIFALRFLSIFFLSVFIPRLISAAVDWMSTILLYTAWP